jgi:hypothetical protein
MYIIIIIIIIIIMTEVIKERLSFQILDNENNNENSIWNRNKYSEWMDSYNTANGDTDTRQLQEPDLLDKSLDWCLCSDQASLGKLVTFPFKSSRTRMGTMRLVF